MAELDRKIPPQNIEAEQSVLGAILIDADAMHRVVSVLHPEYFYKDAHRLVFVAMLELAERGEPIDLVTLTEKLRTKSELERVGGASYLADLADSVSTSANIEYYAKIVEEKALLRKLISAGSEIVESAFSETQETEQILDQAERKLFEITGSRHQKGFTHIKNILEDVMADIERMSDTESGLLGISSGYVDLDRFTSGFQPSDLIIVAARPSMGKTALCLNFAADIAIRQKKTVAIFSLEMSKESLVQRLLCADSEVNSNRIRTGNLKDQDLKRITRSLGRLDEANIYIDDTPSISAMELRAKARRIKMDKGLDIIIIDYLQLMTGSRSKDGNRNQEISEISRLLKSISRELNVPLIALSQLSRAVEQRTEKKPKLSDLRESGEIEQTADLVIFVHREDYYEMQNVPTSLTELIIAKHRNGPTGMAEVLFLKEFTKFVPKENKLDA